jgi:hypothetical protein
VRLLPDCPSLEFSCPTTLTESGSDLRRESIPDCAAPSGFLNLLTLCSSRNLSSLVSCW